MAKRIGLINCANAAQDMACSVGGCIGSVQHGGGQFEQYKDDGGSVLVGIVSCAGCPTLHAPEKIINPARSLAVFKPDAIHLSTCMVALCPFIKKYKSVLEERFPEIDIVIGTHGDEMNEELQDFVDAMKEMMSRENPNLADFFG